MDSKHTLRPDTPSPISLQIRSPGLQKKQQVSPLNSELLIAARKGYSKEVKRILTEGGGSVATSTMDRHGRNCLHLACHYGQQETALAILTQDVIDINSTSKRGFTPLHEASGEGHLSVVFLLLAMGAFLRARSREGWTALMSACYNGHTDVAKVFIAAGLDINATNKNGFTALHVAAWKGHTSTVEHLIREGAAITMKTSNNKTALDIAQEDNQLEVITILQAASVRESEQPFYRIVALEGQLKLAQEKLIETQKKHNETIVAEREEMARNFESMKKQLIEERVAEKNPLILTEEASDESNGVEVNSKGNSSMLQDLESQMNKSENKAKMKKQVKVSTFTNGRTSLASFPVAVSPLVTRSHNPASPSPKKLEKKTIDSLGLESAQLKPTMPTYNQGTRYSLDGKLIYATPPRANEDKLTITQLVANNLNSPGTIALVRKELKADGLTPKIQRKFHKQGLLAVQDLVHPLEKTSPPMEGRRKQKEGNGSDN